MFWTARGGGSALARVSRCARRGGGRRALKRTRPSCRPGHPVYILAAAAAAAALGFSA